MEVLDACVGALEKSPQNMEVSEDHIPTAAAYCLLPIFWRRVAAMADFTCACFCGVSAGVQAGQERPGQEVRRPVARSCRRGLRPLCHLRGAAPML